MIDLLESRDKIDKIDMEIVRLFGERMKICEDVAEYKIATGKKVLDAERERERTFPSDRIRTFPVCIL